MKPWIALTQINVTWSEIAIDPLTWYIIGSLTALWGMSSTSARSASKSSLDSYDESMDEYSYDSSSENNAYSFKELTQPLGRAMKELKLFLNKQFFRCLVSQTHPFLFFPSTQCMSGRKCTGQKTWSSRTTRRHTCLTTGGERWSTEQAHQVDQRYTVILLWKFKIPCRHGSLSGQHDCSTATHVWLQWRWRCLVGPSKGISRWSKRAC